MKSRFRLPLLAAFLLGSLSIPCFADTLVTIPLDGVVIKSGAVITVSSTSAIDKANLYTYSISGSCHGTGNLSSAVPPGTDFVAFLKKFDTKQTLVPFLQGTVLDVKQRFPFLCLNRLAKGSFTFNNIPISGMLRAEAGISKSGTCYAKITNLSFKVGPFVDTTDTIVIDNGQCVVGVAASAGGPQPNLYIHAAPDPIRGQVVLGGTDGQVADGGSLAIGKTKTAIVFVQNEGVATDSFVFSNPVTTGTAFTQKFLFGRKDVTAAITSGTFEIDNVKPGASRTIRWKITNNSAATGVDDGTPVIEAVSKTNNLRTDSVGFFVEGE